MADKVRFFDYALQFREREQDYIEIIRETFSRGSFILGPELERFERNFAAFVGSKHAIGIGNCTDGLLLCLYALGIGQGDEVLTVSHTFVATVEVIVALGAKPVFVDIADDHNMDIDQAGDLISTKTKAILPVHLNGRICSKIDRLVEVAAENNLIIIEDAAQAIGATFRGKGAGTFGRAGCFSFYPAKLLGTFGDAGAIVTDDDGLAEKLRMIRNHGRSSHGDVRVWGMNSRMDNVHAAILDFKLAFVKNWIQRRREIAGMYQRGLCAIDELTLPPAPENAADHFDVYQNYEIEADRQGDLRRYLEEHGIETALPWGGRGVHQFEDLGMADNKLPRTEALFSRAIMLPMYPELADDQVEYIIEVIRNFYSQAPDRYAMHESSSF